MIHPFNPKLLEVKCTAKFLDVNNPEVSKMKQGATVLPIGQSMTMAHGFVHRLLGPFH